MIEETCVAFDYSAEAELFPTRSEIEATTNRLQTFCESCGGRALRD